MDIKLKMRLEAYLAENLFEEEIFAAEKAGTPPPVVCFSLANRIKLDKFFEQNVGETFSEMLVRLIKESGEKNSDVYNRAKIDRRLFHRIVNNKNYQPKKDTAVALSLALRLDLDEAKDFLAAAGFTLSKSKRDLIISFFIENEIFDVDELNDCLYEHNQNLLGDKKNSLSPPD
ncbi:MAG: hypothetical protein II857_03980 [Selenomonadaceae bacterium]|nr:hypothetical protein [Selenomonadaceae bacterium]